MRISDWSSDVCSSDLELSTGPPVRGVDRRALVEFAGRIEAEEPAVGAGLELIAGTRVIDRHRPVEVSERQRSRHLAPRCDVDALCGAAEVLDMRDPSRTDEERTLGLGGEAWLILVDQHRVELRHRSRVSRSEEHTSELQSIMRISYAVFCLQNKKNNNSFVSF